MQSRSVIRRLGGWGGLPLVGAALWAGLVVGLIELAVIVLRAEFVRNGLYRRNAHFPWMIPASTAAMLGAFGLVLALAVRPIPRVGRSLTIFLICALALMAPLLAVPALRASACLAMAVGLAAWIAPVIGRRPEAFGRFVRRSGAALGVVFALLLIGSFSRGFWTARPLAKPALPGAPNVLLIVLDTVRADATSLYGYPRETTPRIDAFARRGRTFDRAIAPAPWTLPSHASLFTGRWAWELAVGPDQALDGRHPTLAEYLSSQGYDTAGFVANTVFCSAEYGLARGFEHYEDHVVSPLEVLRSSALGWLACKRLEPAVDGLCEALGREPRHALEIDYYRKSAARINQDALRWIDRRRDPERPFFVFLNYLDAHDPYLPPEESDWRFGARPRSLDEFRVLRRWSSDEVSRRDPRSIKLARDAYDDCLAALDEQVGRLLDALARRGALEETVVIITSDHGEHFGEHEHDGQPLFGHRKSLYQPEIRVPLVIVAPWRVPPSSREARPASLRDLPATIVDLLGVADRSPFPGKSLMTPPAVVAGAEPSDAVLSEFASKTDLEPGRRYWGSNPGLLRALVADGKVYHRRHDGREELYDLNADPTETRDLSQSETFGPLLRRLRAELDDLAPTGGG
jgi:arylsulfatase A-like enzyme